MQTVAADSVNRDFEDSDSDSSGSKILEHGTLLRQYDARAVSGTVDYWQIKFEMLTNSISYDGDNTYNGMKGNSTDVTSSHNKWNTNDTKYWVGSGTTQQEEADEYDHISNLAGDFAGIIPVLGDALTAFEVLVHLTDLFEDAGGEVINRDWTWGDAFSGAPQSEIFNRFDAECDPGERAGFTATDYASAERYDGTGKFLSAETEFLVNFAAPETSPSSLTRMSASSLESKGISTVSAKQIRRNPLKYGFTPREASDLKPSDIVYFAPVDIEVTTG
ncbi:hypothetical protein [Haloprofundus salilacus]|uniref:hypothetical protein n=1 Tax=Haloprofundus salilacus TaxID=2876190 RepID=UPI001CC9BA56|nr:hypothetical protein [Haloprofundus salilacus]